MKMQRNRILLLLLAGIICLLGCTQNNTAGIMGNLELTIDTAGERGLQTVSMETACYNVTVRNSEGAVVLEYLNSTRTSFSESVPAGLYSVSVSALNKEGRIIGEGSASVTVEPGKAASCFVSVKEIQGKGTLSFSYSGSEADGLVVEILNASMESVASLSLDYQDGTYSGTIELDNGFYLFTVVRADGASVDSDSVRVLANLDTPIFDESNLTTITMLYATALTEVGGIPDDWAGYQILKSRFGIDLQLQMLPSVASDQDIMIRTMAAAGELPDFFMVSKSVWTDLVKQGLFADVTDDFAKMPERSKVMFGKSSKNYTTYNGRNYGFATPSSFAGNEGLLVRKDWLDNLGLAVPTTLDDLYDVLYAFTYNDPDGNGKNDTYGYGAFVEETVSYEIYPGRRFEPLMGAFGVEGTWNMSADNFGLRIHDAAYYDWMVFFKKCIDNGVIDPNWQSYKKDDFRAAWKQGKFGVFREQNSAYASQNNYAPFDANFPEGELIVLDAPIGPSGKSSIGPLVEGLRIFAINADVSPEKHAKIVQMFEWMSYGEGYMLCSYGEEGKNYILDSEGVPQPDDSLGDMGYSKVSGQRYIQLRNCSLNYNNDVEIAVRYPSYITKVSQKRMSAGDVLIDMQSKTWTRTPGQNNMPKPESTDVTTYYQQGVAEFLSGKRELNEANWKAFVEQFDTIGGLTWEQAGYEYASEFGYLL